LRKLRYTALFGIIALLLAMTAVPAFASTVRIVDDNAGTSLACAGAKFKTIQGALNASAAGDTINVCPGLYTGFTLNKSVTLVATPALQAHVTQGLSSVESPKISITASNARLEGFDVSGASIGIAVNASGVVVKKNKVRATPIAGIQVNVPNVRVVENTVINTGTISDHTTAGIRLGQLAVRTEAILVSGVTVLRNKVNGNKSAGILLFGADGNQVSSNTTNNNGTDGIDLCAGSDGNLIEGNTSKANGFDGIFPDNPLTNFCSLGGPSSVNNAIRSNTMLNNTGLDARDGTVGTGTAGTANFWTFNTCVTDAPDGLCPPVILAAAPQDARLATEKVRP
jgi:parallel beta-helix repeat protein